MQVLVREHVNPRFFCDFFTFPANVEEGIGSGVIECRRFAQHSRRHGEDHEGVHSTVNDATKENEILFLC